MNDYNGFNPSYLTSLTPTSGPCYNFLKNNYATKITVWMVPHVIKHKDESEVITWRCNWGNVCESNCLYAMSKDKNWQLTPAYPSNAKV